MVATQDRTVRAWHDQVETRVKITGSGPPVVYLHGAFGPMPDPLVPMLSGSYTVYAPEHPGTSPGAPDEIKPIDTIWDLVLYYYELFDALGLDSPAVIGHSFGGMVACEIAATNPGRVSKLVLINSAGLWNDAYPVRNWMATPFADLPKLMFADQESPLAKMAAAGLADTSDASVDAIIQMMWSLACTGRFVWPIPDRGLKKRLHRITAPTLIVWGRHDGIIPVEYAQDFAAALANARVEIIENAAHAPQMEQTAAVLPLIQQFLAD
jgi:pimeloyl-ACP methyl ester carboxylesterase